MYTQLVILHPAHMPDALAKKIAAEVFFSLCVCFFFALDEAEIFGEKDWRVSGRQRASSQ